MGNNQRIITITSINEILKERKGKCLSTRFINSTMKMDWQCEKGHEWKAIYANVINNKSWCPYCNQNSNNADAVFSSFSKNSNSYLYFYIAGMNSLQKIKKRLKVDDKLDLFYSSEKKTIGVIVIIL